MKRYYDLWRARIKSLVKAAQGRPVALVVLFGLSLRQPVQRMAQRHSASGFRGRA